MLIVTDIKGLDDIDIRKPFSLLDGLLGDKHLFRYSMIGGKSKLLEDLGIVSVRVHDLSRGNSDEFSLEDFFQYSVQPT